MTLDGSKWHSYERECLNAKIGNKRLKDDCSATVKL